MKQLYLFIFLLFTKSILYSQNIEHDKQLLIQREISNYQKMVDYNVNPNTLNYDLKYQRLDLTLDPAVYQISGSVTSHFLPNQNLNSIYFDLTNQLNVSSVIYHGMSLSYQQLVSKEIKIDFTSPIIANTLDSLTIYYSGAPATNNNAFRTGIQNSIPVVSTLSEPYGAQDWFPTKQSLNDKIDAMDFKITTPSQYSVAANGKFMYETSLSSGDKLTFWRTNYPIPAYLAAFSITNFSKINDVIGNPPFPFVNYVYPASTSNTTIMSNIEWTKQVMVLFENYFGPYPFRNEKYGHMEFNHQGVCMEHQTMSSMSSWGRYVIAHELAHQWFGDKLTCETWNDIWLNEGFATYGEHLANEKLIMNSSDFLNWLRGQRDYITSSPAGSTYVATSNLNSIGSIFSGRLSYAKGGFILRMLKWKLGESAFYQAIKDYHQRPDLAYQYVNTTDLINSLQLSTGQNFTEFFNDWVYGQGYPTYTITWDQSSSDLSMTLKANQSQSHTSVGFFEMPLPIKVIGTAGQVLDLKLENTMNGQIFTVPVGFQIQSISFNEDLQIIEKNSTVAFDSSLKTDELEYESIVLYPNPATKEISMKGLKSKTTYEVFSTDGKLIRKGILHPKKTISIEEFQKGVYILKVNDRNFKFTKK